MNSIKALFKRFVLLINIFFYRIKYGKEMLLFRGAVIFHNGRIVNNNWGDDLNIYLAEKVLGKKLIPVNVDKLFFRNIENVYLCIGSVLSWYNLDGKIIIGTGIMNPEEKIQGTPKKIVCVRGPKTRELLINHGISCPMEYGDMALLLPLFYKPATSCTNDNPVIILNHGTKLDDAIGIVRDIQNQFGANIVSMSNYSTWTDIIDKIVNAKFVISESLHGLIVAEAYGIPCVWVEFKKHPEYWNFKFEDFYESIGRMDEQSVKLYQESYEDIIYEKIDGWKKTDIDYSKILCNIRENAF